LRHAVTPEIESLGPPTHWTQLPADTDRKRHRRRDRVLPYRRVEVGGGDESRLRPATESMASALTACWRFASGTATKPPNPMICFASGSTPRRQSGSPRRRSWSIPAPDRNVRKNTETQTRKLSRLDNGSNEAFSTRSSTRAASSLHPSGLDHRNYRGSDGLEQLRPGGDYSGQVGVMRQSAGSAFGSARGTRTGRHYRFLAKIMAVRLQCNPFAFSEFRRV
jgi:hypothetical protein